MLVITYKPNLQTQQIDIPPIFLQLQPHLLALTVHALIDQVYQELKNYLSPFVTAEHLRLELPSHQVLFRNTPLFFYLNYGQYVQSIYCSISCTQKIREENTAFDNYRYAMIMRISHRKATEGCKDRFILGKQKSIQEMKFKELLKVGDRFILGGKLIEITKQDLEEKWLVKNWKKHENRENHCVYICVDRLVNQ